MTGEAVPGDEFRYFVVQEPSEHGRWWIDRSPRFHNPRDAVDFARKLDPRQFPKWRIKKFHETVLLTSEHFRV